jgi:hypothetical protein
MAAQDVAKEVANGLQLPVKAVVNPDGTPITSTSYPLAAKTVTYAGGTTNDPGDFDGTGSPQTLFTVTGQCLVAVIAECSTTLTGASATLRVGNSTTNTRYLPSTTGTTITAGKTLDLSGLVSAGTAPNTTPNQVAFDSEAIIATVGTADITAGVVTYYCFWKPLSAGAHVTAA